MFFSVRPLIFVHICLFPKSPHMTILHISISALHATFRRWECPSCLKENSIMRQLAFGIKRCVRNLTFMPANTLTPSFQCLNNPGICPGFKSVVRERGPSSVGIKCLGRLCTTRIKPFPGSLTCTLGFCLKCCCLLTMRQFPYLPVVSQNTVPKLHQSLPCQFL